MRANFRRGMRIRIRSHMLVLGGGYQNKYGTVTEVRASYSARPFIIVSLDDGEKIGVHPEDIVKA